MTGPACLVVGRNLGDAVMTVSFAKALAATGRGPLIVWTFPQAQFLFEPLQNCEVVVSSFPMGSTVHTFMRGGWRSFVAVLCNLRRRRVAMAIELIGDVRERTIARLLGADQVFGPTWADDHPFRRHIRFGRRRALSEEQIPASEPNIYSAQAALLRRIAGVSPEFVRTKPPLLGRLVIGFHPFASQACKLWPDTDWQQLLRSLTAEGHRLVAIGAPHERDALLKLVPVDVGPVELVTVALDGLRDRMQPLDVFLGLDSFAVHLAASLGIRTVVLVGPNDPRIFTPPLATALFAPGVCPYQPCHGKPVCIGREIQYICMRSIEVTQVEAAVLGRRIDDRSRVKVFRIAPEVRSDEPCEAG